MSNKQFLLPTNSTPGSGGGGGGTTTNALTLNNSGAGSASGTTFNGSAPVTISTNTIGAAPTASPTFTGTVTLPAALSVPNTTVVTAPSTVAEFDTPDNGAFVFKSKSVASGDCSVVLSGGEVSLFGSVNGGVSINSNGAPIQLLDTAGGITLGTGLITIGATISAYDGTATVGAGIPSLIAKSSLTAQAAAIAATTIFAVVNAGLYRVNYVATMTTAASAGGALGGTTGFQVKYTNQNDSVVKTSNPTTPTISAAVTTTGTQISGSLIANCKASTNLQYLFGYTAGTPTAGAFDLAISVEYLG